jgi:hypothetical protein
VKGAWLVGRVATMVYAEEVSPSQSPGLAGAFHPVPVQSSQLEGHLPAPLTLHPRKGATQREKESGVLFTPSPVDRRSSGPGSGLLGILGGHWDYRFPHSGRSFGPGLLPAFPLQPGGSSPHEHKSTRTYHGMQAPVQIQICDSPEPPSPLGFSGLARGGFTWGLHTIGRSTRMGLSGETPDGKGPLFNKVGRTGEAQTAAT